MYQSTKTFGHELGISTAFRQWRAGSHCNQIHGYALSFKVTFQARHLDARGWVVDFGSLKPLKEAIQIAFDHRLVVAHDDPQRGRIEALGGALIADVRIADAVGCEAFAKHVYAMAMRHLAGDPETAGRVHVVSVECAEHGANSAIYFGD